MATMLRRIAEKRGHGPDEVITGQGVRKIDDVIAELRERQKNDPRDTGIYERNIQQLLRQKKAQQSR